MGIEIDLGSRRQCSEAQGVNLGRLPSRFLVDVQYGGNLSFARKGLSWRCRVQFELIAAGGENSSKSSNEF
jgi:hypothetical protein